ncbi:ABC transporter substrate-binding protein [Chelativorans salis]|uniref:ABC transporter substrate-binding protein n=1 Tax=Chelativorans salis TaxID=2978478 RepID=A0ABT2LKV0_9HYPH|nr:ABC transporter substrate-binding protein [Chelativorans sp. EGI FJ00035]MCT7374278.1 ABC transporter substrate-binding protein [Chelativorans sp. EGI FJ00035]
MRSRSMFTATVMMLAALWSLSAHAESTIRIGVLEFGTVNWELDVIKRHGLDEKQGIQLEQVNLASNQATTVALQAGEVDMIVSDWLWVSRQRANGRTYTFVPFSSSVGALMVPPDSDIRSLADLKGKKIAIAGGPLDKGWLLLRGLAERDHGLDLEAESEQVFGAPPLLAKKAMQGEVDAVLNYWHYSARLEAKGFRQVIGANEAAMELGADGPISAVGYVFDEEWAAQNIEAVKAFFDASREAKTLLRTSDEEWETLREKTGAEDDETLRALRDRFREGIPSRPLSEERDDTARVYEVLAEIGGEKLVGKAKRMAPGTFWPILVDGS